MPGSLFNYHYGQNDAIKGKRIILQAQKIGKPYVIGDMTSKDQGQRVKADDAVAWIEAPYVIGKMKL